MPTGKDILARYERKIEGVSDPDAKAFINALQPYNGPDPFGHPLSIIHQMDRFDKHRELVIVSPVVIRRHGPRAFGAIMEHEKTKSKRSFAKLQRAMKVNSKTFPEIVFREFGNRKAQPVLMGLQELGDFVRAVIGQSERFFR